MQPEYLLTDYSDGDYLFAGSAKTVGAFYFYIGLHWGKRDIGNEVA